MNFKKRPDTSQSSLALLLACLLAAPASLRAEAETLHYQGRLTVGAAAHQGSTYFKFALYNPKTAKIVWSNDGTTGTGSPAAAITLDVENGLFSVSLGSPPMPPIGSDLFGDAPLMLRIWADTGSGMVLLSPDQKLEPVAIAHHAETVPARSITSSELATAAVTAVKIADGAVTADKLGSNAVTDGKIASGAVTASKIADGTIAGSKIASGTITGTHIAAGTITGTDIAAGTITNSDISSSAAISASKISDGAGSGLDADLLDGISSSGFLRSNADSTFTGSRLTVQNDLRLPSLATLSFENGSSTIAGFLGSISITAQGSGDILLTPGDQVIIGGDTSIDGSTLYVDASNNAVGFGTGSPESRLHVKDPDLADTALFERSGQTTNESASALRVRTTKTSAPGNEFGTGIDFEVDSSSFAQPITTGSIRSEYLAIGDVEYGRLIFDVKPVGESQPLVRAATLSQGLLVVDGALYAETLSLTSDSSSVATLRRDDDGTLVAFKKRYLTNPVPATVGSITLSGGTVSYNAFTGSHYAHTSDRIDLGLLVTMTGDNRFGDADKESEPHYGIRVCTAENSQAVLGTYGGQPTEAENDDAAEDSLEPPHLINSVGNAHLWVADTGADIKPGDYLISSAVPGHAQLDPRTAPESHIIGRAAEAVAWDRVDATTTGGIRHAKITILFDSFARYNPPELRNQLVDLPAER
jgi:hypothetical protein